VNSIFDFATPPFRDLRESIWLDVLGRAAEESVPGVIFTLVFEPTLLPGFFDRLRERVEKAGRVCASLRASLRYRREPEAHHAAESRRISQGHRLRVSARCFASP
jgi:hypothetical protein